MAHPAVNHHKYQLEHLIIFILYNSLYNIRIEALSFHSQELTRQVLLSMIKYNVLTNHKFCYFIILYPCHPLSHE